MPGARAMYFLVNERQNRWWLDAEKDRRSSYAREDAAPLPTEPQRERSTFGSRLAIRLRLIVRPAAG
jgi:hypothetical protein